MFHRIQDYELISGAGRWYRTRAYADGQPDGTWDGWLVFFPVAGGPAIASGRETTQTTLRALEVWAARLSPVYIEGALDRALKLSEQPPLLAHLAAAEYEALEDAERLESVAEVQRANADVDEAAASLARSDAERLRRERLATEGALAATEEAAAMLDAKAHDRAARDARAVASDAADRRRVAQAAAKPEGRAKVRHGKRR
jgi:hypothetical protein